MITQIHKHQSDTF